MSSDQPELTDYVHLFGTYGEDLGEIYKTPEAEQYGFLFEKLVRLLVRPSSYNLGLPEPFRRTAHRYLDGDPATLAHMGNPVDRNFMICDLHDWIMLNGGLALRRQEKSE